MQAGPNNPTAFADAAEMRNQRFSDDGYLFGTEPNVWLRKTRPTSRTKVIPGLSVTNGHGTYAKDRRQMGGEKDLGWHTFV